MNGSDELCRILLANGIDTCFANPGTSEMHFVAALDREARMRCVLGLSEGVVTGAADGYGRMADRPAATLLHLGPGLANGLANLHNARRARTPLVNVVGDHASYHVSLDAPLTSDVEGLATPMSHWVDRVASTRELRKKTERAIHIAVETPGVATLILPADISWSPVNYGHYEPAERNEAQLPSKHEINRAAELLKKSHSPALFLGAGAARTEALDVAGRVAKATGAKLFTDRPARWQRGAGRVAPTPVPYNVQHALEALRGTDAAVIIGGREPVGFFAYPGKPGRLLPDGCELIDLAGPEHNLLELLKELASELGAEKVAPYVRRERNNELVSPTGILTPDGISCSVARHLPDGAIICDESVTSSGRLPTLASSMAPHDYLPLTGGAIGQGIPLAVGAAIAAPGQKVVALQADGSGMYTVQGLWTQARERLDIVSVIFSNRGYSILKKEMRNLGVDSFGENARRVLDIDDPALDWCSIAGGMGVEAIRVEMCEDFDRIFKAAMRRSGPLVIEAII